MKTSTCRRFVLLHPPRQLRTLASIAILAASGVLVCSAAQAQALRLPRVTLPTNMTAQPGARISGSIGGTASRPVLNIRQLDAAAILRWSTFDIGADASVIIDQPSSTATLLNKVDGGLIQNKTVIEGMLNANGQVYIYNLNGIIFGKTSQVNVNSLVATTLKIDDQRFLAGLLAPNPVPIFQAASTAWPGAVVVEGERNVSGALEQAQLTAARGGRIVLVGSSVSNSGQLSAPDGQVLAAAATDKVFLAAPTSVSMRGLLVEVVTGGTVTNASLGKIRVDKGNASLVGLAVNQNGTISATSSVQANGSIYLRAQDSAVYNPVTFKADATHGGQLVLGAGSVTEVQPDLADTSTAAKSSYNASQVNLAAKSVHLLQNAKVIAPGGDVTVAAQANPRQRATDGVSGGAIGSSGVYLEAGASIDVAGTTSTQLAMESNVLTVELRGTELADVPLQRTSVLRGKTVKIDRRKGTPLANVQGWLDLVEYGIGEDTATGGTVSFRADQEVVLAQGAEVNVSGGKVSYKDGYVATTQLRSGRYSVDIGSASASRLYTGLYDAVAGRRNFEAGYSEGRNAGSVRFDAPALLLRGSLLGSAMPGVRQRDVAASNYPKGGELVIGSNGRVGSLNAFGEFSFFGTIDFGGKATSNIATPVFGSAWNFLNPDLQTLRTTLDLDPAILASGGFTHINAYARDSDPSGTIPGKIAVSADVKLNPGGEFRVAAQQTVSINADITVPGGMIEAKAATDKLSVGTEVALDVAGLWTNDRRATRDRRDRLGKPTAAVVTTGGSIILAGKGTRTDTAGLDIGANVTFDASGGAWQNTIGKIVGGNGGIIALTAGALDDSLPLTAGLKLGIGSSYSAYGLSNGGTLKLGGRNVTLGADSSADPLDLALPAAWFTTGGFSKYDITAAGNLTVLGNAVIAPRMDNWIANRKTRSKAGGRMADAFVVDRLSLGDARGTRGASSLSLSAAAQVVDDAGRLWMQQGAVIATDPGASVTLSAGRQLTVDGQISAPGGMASLLLSVDPNIVSIPYRSERSIWLSSTALIDVSATAAGLWANRSGKTQGNLLDGGSIRIGRLNGTDFASATGFVVIEQGARLDVSGAQASMTLSSGRFGSQTRQVASAGGSIDIRAREGMLIEGTLSGDGGSTEVAGGSLSLVLDREAFAGPANSPTAAHDLVVLAQKFAAGTTNEYIVPRTLHADQSFGVDLEGKAYVLAKTLNGGGFDRLRLKSQDSISFDPANGITGLAASSTISLDAPVIGVRNASTASQVALAAASVGLGNSDWRYQTTAAALSASLGDGATLDVNASTIDLTGSFALRGFAVANFKASQDIRLSGVVAADLSLAPAVFLPAIHAYGSLKGVGTLTFASAQLYPTSMSEFSLVSSGAGSKIEFQGNGNAGADPLSAAGRLSVSAGDIVQNGVLRAPTGSITFNAEENLRFGSGSLTSVAGSATVPLGLVSNGRDWIYDFGNGHTVTLNNTSASNSVVLPEKKVTSTAKSIKLAAGAVIDLSGGGDLYAYEFTAGPGGTRDVLGMLDKDGNRLKDSKGNILPTNVFAVLPVYGNGLAPIDFQYQQDGGLATGDRIYLSGMPGLAAGFYTLLPAHYALLPGAYAVSAVAGTRDMTAATNHAKTDGNWVVAGYRGSAVANDSRWSGFLLTSGDQVHKQSAFSDYSANTFLASSSPMDGGHVVFDVTKSLSLDGLVRLRAASGGRNGIADISAPEIAIVSERSDPLPVESAAGTLKLTVSDLTALGADSLLLGAVRTTTSAGDRITVGAANVIVENDAAHPLSGPEIIVAATDNLILKDGSAVAAQGALSRTPQNLLIVNKSAPTAGADGALLRVSSGAAVALQRRYTAADGSVSAPAGVKGTLDVGANVTLAAGGSVMLDATKSTVISSTLALSSGTALGLGASRIMLGDDAPVTLDVLRFDTAGLLALNSLSSLALTSYSTIDVYGGVTLGDVAMQNLSFSAGGMRGMLGVNVPQATFTAQTIRFDLAGTDAAAGSATGSVVFAAKDIEIGNGAFALHGFSLAALNASNEIRAAGVNGKVGNDADLTLRAGRITARGGKDATVTAGGRLTLTQGSGVVGDLPALELGGRLTFEGQTITSDASIVAVAGRVSLTSTATVSDIINGLDVSDGTINVAGGIISAAGGSKTFGSTLAYAPAGSIALDGGAGNVNVGALATLDVSAVGANAGRIAVTANNGSNGQAALNGALKGSAVAGVAGTLPNQGQFALDVDDVGSSGQFTALNDNLNASGFTDSRSVRVRLGDIVIADKGNDANGKRIDAIKAHQLVLAADYGDIALDGSIDASGAKGGSIELYAAAPNASSSKGKVQIGATALLKASATQAASSAAGSSGDGGRIVIGTSTTDGSAPGTSSSGTSISVASGARFNVAASGAGQDGSILLRAPRLSGNNDVAISVTNNTTLADASAIRDSNGNLLRNGAVTVEGYKVYSSAGNVSIGTAADTASHSSLQAAVATSGEAATAGKMYSESSTYLGAANRSAVQTRLGATVAYQAGVEVRAAGDINVSVNESVANAQNRGWDLNVWRFGDQAGVLTLRAGGNLNITGSISDGFVKPVGNIAMPGWELDSSVNGSWSYRLAGGADLAAANPLDVKTAGNVSLAFARSDTSNDQPVALIRSGTGRIDIAAGRDVKLGSVAVNIPDPFDNSSTVSAVLGASIYTAGLDAGRVTGAEGEFLAPRKQNINSIYANGSTTAQTTARFATDGGAISITAGGDVVGAITSQLVNAWLFRRGKVTSAADGSIVFDGQTFPEATAVPARRYENVLSTGWWSRYDYFNQGVATFAGGDITVTAAGNFRNLSLNAATSGQVPAVSVTDKRPTTLVERGGGDIIVHAGGDIRGGSYYVQKGNATLRAGGSVVAGDNTVADDDLGHVTLRPVLAVGDGRIDITAMGNVELETVFNPTLLLQSIYNADVNTSGSGGRRSPLSVFSTYKDNGAITLTSLSGDVHFGNHVAALSKASAPWITNPDTTFIVYPASLRVTALSGSIILDNGFSLWPSPVGQLELLAEQSVRVAFPRRSSDQQNIFGVQPIAMIDAAPASLPSVLAPRTSIDDFVTILNPADNSDGLAHHTSTGLHAGDSQSVRIVALTGDIVGENYFGGSNGHVTLIVPKAVEILAGRDIRDFGFKIQHLSADDVSTLTAGRDFIDTTFPDLNPVRHHVSGPGRLDITAGRDIDLGTSSGIVTRGNLDNPYLPDAGASINLVAGAKPDYANFANLYLTADELPLLSRNDLVALNDIFFKKLRVASGADGGELDLPAFDAIIASLFPTTAISGGNINVFGSQVKTARGGAINLFSPGGSIQAGLAEKPSWVKRKLLDDKTFESNLGVYTIAGGNLQSLVKKDFLVNQGRVFTLGGGDITLVSQYGDIDAGKGAKTAQSTPPPVIRTDATGNTIVDISGSISGSGIATLRTAPDVPASSVYPIAPRGIFDAGDAGVRSTGSVNIVAATVLNASNISAAGTVSGTNTTDTSGLSSAISAPINTTQTRTEDIVKSMENQSAGAGGTLNVEVIGFGSDQQSVTQAGQNSSSSPAPCKANDDADVECKKNRKQP